MTSGHSQQAPSGTGQAGFFSTDDKATFNDIFFMILGWREEG
jgi:hypothetical protein